MSRCLVNLVRMLIEIGNFTPRLKTDDQYFGVKPDITGNC